MQPQCDFAFNSYQQIILTQCNNKRKSAGSEPLSAAVPSQGRGRSLKTKEERIGDAPLRDLGSQQALPVPSPPTARASSEQPSDTSAPGRVARGTTATWPPGKLGQAWAPSAFPSAQKNPSAFEGQTVAGGVCLRLASQQRGIEGHTSSCLAFPF